MPVYRGPDGRIDLRSLTLDELKQELSGLGKESFRALQVYKWIWQRGARSFEEMTNISKDSRAALAERFYLPELKNYAVLGSEDGTRKWVWELTDESHIESVLIPDHNEERERDRLTLCVSSQVGCAMACAFCLTGDLGLKRNLRTSEIVSQVHQVAQAIKPEGLRITNLVFMGMGEPLHNLQNVLPALKILLDDEALGFSHRRITVSTVGLVNKMAELADAVPVNLAVSLNATTNEQRRQIMPITRRYDVEALMEGCRNFPLIQGKRITFEYVMMHGFNDSMDDAARLTRLMRGQKAKVNLIPYNENPNREILRPPEPHVKAFQHYLVSRGIQCSVRTTRGIDISAACGQLGKATEGLRIEEAQHPGPRISLDDSSAVES